MVVVDVVQAIRRTAGCGIGRVTAPGGVRLSNVIEGANHAFDNIVDVGEVAAMIAVVEHVDWFAINNVLGEFEQRHIGPTPGPVDGEKS